jgi:nicotinate-nucleotide adenylyltransferase
VTVEPPLEPARETIAGSIGVLGGTFDPVHLGHLAIAEDAREALGLERVLFIPAAAPPHKPGRPISPGETRLAMVELAIAGNPAFAVDRVELDRPGPSYAVDTIELLAARERAAGRDPDLTFILSAEAFRELPSWRSPDRLLELCRFAVVPRAGTETPDRAWVEARFPGRADRVTFLAGPLLGVSSTGIRARIRAGRSIRYLVPDAVAQYIADHGLYLSTVSRTRQA